jgi:hypothetical protein
MPSIAVPEAFIAVTAATAVGLLTVGSGNTANLYPGAYAWLAKDDGTLSYRIKILAVDSTANTVLARRMPIKQDRFSQTYVDDEGNPPPSYGLTDFSTFNGVGCHICQERQTAPIDPSFSKRSVP